MKFLAVTNHGLEDIGKEEIEGLLNRKCDFERSKVFFEGDIQDIYHLNYLCRTVNKIYILLVRSYFETLEDIYNLAKNVDYSNFIASSQTFAVRSSRSGAHDFTSIDVSRVVGQAVIDSYMSEKKCRLKVNLDDPDIEIKALVVDDKFILGINTTGEGLHKRGYRVYQHPAPLKTTIAASLLKISGWAGEPLLDPMCGGGTIPIEAAMRARNIPPGKFRNFAFQKFHFFDPLEYREIVEKAEEMVNRDTYPIVGVEKYIKHIKGAILNAESAGVLDTIEFIHGDALEIEYPSEVEYIIANPPYGIRIARRSKLEFFYKKFIKKISNLTGVVLTVIIGNRYFADLCPFKLLHKRKILYGELLTDILVYKID
ncbi:MAG: tRNA (guanine(6)-N2)-methyltransferase [Candidatus Odinarchaeia archaeon]